MTRRAARQRKIVFLAGGVSQTVVGEPHLVGIDVDVISRHFVIGIILSRRPHRKEKLLPAPRHCRRAAKKSVAAFGGQADAAVDGMFGGDFGRIEPQDTANGIRAVFQRGRAFDDFGFHDGILIDFESVVAAPLLGFVADVVLDDSHAIEPKPPYNGFALRRTYRNRGKTGDFFEAFAQTSA